MRGRGVTALLTTFMGRHIKIYTSVGVFTTMSPVLNVPDRRLIFGVYTIFSADVIRPSIKSVMTYSPDENTTLFPPKSDYDFC